MNRVLFPPMAGVLSALGMVTSATSADASRTVLHLDHAGELDDDRLYAEYGEVNERLLDAVPMEQLAAVECFADCRWRGQSHELTVAVRRPSRQLIREAFERAYTDRFGTAALPADPALEIVTLRVRRSARAMSFELPEIDENPAALRAGAHVARNTVSRDGAEGPLLLVDPDATGFIPSGWHLRSLGRGLLLAERKETP
jgi:N-methylhydantoinase A/oxoprolinase/acetone carboxylase beta subunit